MSPIEQRQACVESMVSGGQVVAALGEVWRFICRIQYNSLARYSRPIILWPKSAFSASFLAVSAYGILSPKQIPGFPSLSYVSSWAFLCRMPAPPLIHVENPICLPI